MINKSISLVIPAYNESEIIKETLCIFNHILMCNFLDYEIIVVNDGSTDKTPQIIDDLSRKNHRIKTLHNKNNIGSGASLWLGFQKASKELVISNFADRPFDISALEQIFKHANFEAIDFIVVVRKDRSANTFYRKITSLANYFLIKSLFKINISDFQFVQIYKKKILEGINIHSKETFVPPELMIKLVNKGYKYQEMCYPFDKRTGGKPKCGHPIKILRSVYEIISFWINWKLLKKID